MGHVVEESRRQVKHIGCVQTVEINLQNKDKKWLKWMEFGRRLGCHQMSERSFFIKGYQFPICARCTGVIISSFVAVVVFWWYKMSMIVSFALCAIMFMDWFIQRIEIKSSTNIRRFITGLMGGYGFMTLQMYMYWWLLKCLT